MTKDRRRICVVTGTRAEYGLLYWLMKEIQGDPELTLQIIATGMHLSPEFGLTYRQLEEDGFLIDAKVEMLLSSDTPVGVAKSIGLGIIGFADALDRLRPDILVLLGDRFEILAAAQAALVARIPIAHIGGGDTTEGAVDEAIRHSITKMAHLHFVSNEMSRQRVIQLGENPEHVFNVGSTGIDQIVRLPLMDRETLERELNFRFGPRNLLVTFHPETLSDRPPEEDAKEVVNALKNLSDDVGILFTMPNADAGGRAVMKTIEAFALQRPRTAAYVSLGTARYLSLIRQVDAVVGNSSSGLYEVPSFKKPTVNIGDRQRGRLQAASVVNCPCKSDAVRKAIDQAFEMDCTDTVNPYGDGNSSTRIAATLKGFSDFSPLLRKSFHFLGDRT